MTNPPNDSLPLCQVLEEEYVNLADTGALDENEKEVEITLHGRPVVAKLDWRFYKGHISYSEVVIQKLNIDHDLRRHLTGILPELDIRIEEHSDAGKTQGLDPAKARALEDARTRALEDTLNRLLGVPIYDEDAFKYTNLKDTTRNAVKPHMIAPPVNRPLQQLRKKLRKNPVSRRSPTESTDELAHINRIILEETFPKALEKIYEIRLAAMYQRLHKKKITALSLSGGGIRSGTFALGLIQRLARFGLLDKFHYLSTVSGGGYIGSWLTAWQHRHPDGLTGVMNDLDNTPIRAKIDPDPRSIQHLREYSNFLTPKAGLLTADTWTFVAIYLRNLLLNWMVLIPLLVAVLAIPRLFVALQLAQPAFKIGAIFGFQLGIRHVALVIGGLLLTLAIMYVSLNRPGINQQLIERSRFWRKRMRQEDFLRWCLFPTFSAAVLLTVYLAWSLDNQAVTHTVRAWKWIAYLISGAAVPTMAYVGFLLVLRRWKSKHWHEFNPRELLGALVMIVVGAAGGLLAFVASQVEWLDPTVQNVDQSWRTELYTCMAVPLLLLLLLLLLTLFIGWTSRENMGIEDEDREWWARCNAWVLIAMLVWASLNVLVIFGPLALFAFPEIIAPLGGISGVISLFAGKSSKTPANTDQASPKGLISSIISEWILPALAFVFLIIFFIAISLGTTVVLRTFASPRTPWLAFFAFGGYADRIGKTLNDMEHMRVVHYSRFGFILTFVVISAAIGLLMGWVINLNKFSLHAGYRNRLIRAFLGASRDPRTRNPNPFTGFDPQDNVGMHELRAALLHENDFLDLETLAVRIGKPKKDDELSKFLEQNLSPETRAWLGSYAEPPPHELRQINDRTPLELSQRTKLIEDLNQILEDEKIVANQGQLEKLEEPKVLQTVEDVIQKRLVLTKSFSDCLVARFPPPQRLLHVVNTTLNLVGGKNLAWQQRKAETFAVTPLHSGCFRTGYRKSRFYGGKDGITLGTAAAISGAAASSNMGYYTSSPVLSMVLTLFNVRLGWWLGNPGPAGDTTYFRSSPKLSITPVISEAFGLTNDQSKYVYLTDGGHFENLGIYEMVLRRCHIIVVSDAAADGDYEFGDLGNAIRKIRIDLGVPIEFGEVPIYKEVPEGKTGRYWAFAKIGYSKVDSKVDGKDVEDGILVYIKPAIYGGEPRDVVQYKKANSEFPHQSTADQFFDEPQFESYRALGAYIMELMCSDRTEGDQAAKDMTLGQFIARAYQNYRVPDAPLGKLKDIDWLDKWLERRRA